METQNIEVKPKIGKWKASKIIVKESFNVLMQDKEIMWFPVMSAITTLLATIVLIATGYFVIFNGNIESVDLESNKVLSNVVIYSVLFICYLVGFFITNFFQAGLYLVVQSRFNGVNIGFKDGINEAKKHINKIFIWSLISATVGLVLQIIADKFKLVGRIIASIFGAAWNILTFFSLPALIIGKTTIKESFNESATIIRRTWGETIIVSLGVTLFFSVITFLVFALFIGLIVIVPTVGMIISVGILFVIYVIAISVVSSTLGQIFKLVLYNYAKTGNIPAGFSADIVQAAIKTK
jgi:hypothetical protein